MAGEATQQARNQYIRLRQDVVNVEGQRYHEGDVLVISSVNARRPGEHVDNVYCMCPPWFDYITNEQAEPHLKRQRDAKESAKLAAERAKLDAVYAKIQSAEVDPLAGLGL